MATLTLKIPDDKHKRLQLLEELATISIVQFDSENRFRMLATGGSPERGLESLDQLDKTDSKMSK